MDGHQEEFLFAEGAEPPLALPDLRSELYAGIAAFWELPLGEAATVELRGHPHFSNLQGRLELSRAPDVPFDRREALALRIGKIDFSSRQIVSWCVR